MRPRTTAHPLPYLDDFAMDATFGAAPSSMLVVDSDGRILAANPEAQRNIGHPRRPLTGSLLQDLVADEHRERVLDALANVLSDGLPSPAFWYKLMALDPQGTPVPVEIAFGKLLRADGPPAAVVTLHCLRRMTANALDERTRLEEMLGCAPAFIVGLGADGAINFINRTLPQYPREAVIGMDWLAFFPADQRPKMEAKLRAMLDTGSTQHYDTHTIGADGRTVYFETQLAPTQRDGKIVGAVLVSQDVTDRKIAQAELLANRHMALLGTLAAGVAHEINTPIQFVTDSVEFLREGSNDLLSLLTDPTADTTVDLPYLRDNLPAALDRCRSGLEQIARIVRSLKDFAHPSAEHMAPVDLGRLIETALTIARGEYKFVATVKTELSDLPPVTCHAAEISQVVLNLVVNAAHAIADVVTGTGKLGVITVTTRTEEDLAVIEVSDTGGGIPEAIRTRIFDPFFTTKPAGKGTGQGLSIAWSMIKEHHGGSLTFESVVGKGTTFAIRIPIRAA